MPDMKSDAPRDPALRMLGKLARNNALANYRLAGVVAGLDPSQFEARRTSFFPSLRATLNHILVIDWFYIDALDGGTLGPKAWENEEPFDTAPALYAAQRRSDEKLLAFCDGLAGADLARPIAIHRQSRIQTERCDDVLTHLFAHQTHHRGQAHAMLAGTEAAPPQLDEFIVSDDAKFRTEELAAFGWTEADLGF
ncbi:DinB family protein [Pelagibacterium sp.]|uniref:DinB family protein n=1 Tax=Pelagibacterium sp. TaxID=1967288 RepID=UPI003BAA2B53